jgi:hypothetical protein
MVFVGTGFWSLLAEANLWQSPPWARYKHIHVRSGSAIHGLTRPRGETATGSPLFSGWGSLIVRILP